MAYPWHPAFGKHIDVIYQEKRRGESVYVVVLPNDSGATIPVWMCDPGTCAKMTLGHPHINVRSLEELRAILTELGFHAHPTVTLQSKDKDHGKSQISTTTDLEQTTHAAVQRATPGNETASSKGGSRGTRTASAASRTSRQEKGVRR